MLTENRHAHYDALIAAFCLVACADGEVHIAELARFLPRMQNRNLFGYVDEAKVIADVEREKEALEQNFEKEKTRLLGHIKAVKNDFRAMKDVIDVARITLISDNKIVESEEAILSEIHAILGISEQE